MTSWKTTLVGILAAALQLYANGANLKSIALAVSLAGLGAVAKDHDVTGGAKPNV